MNDKKKKNKMNKFLSDFNSVQLDQTNEEFYSETIVKKLLIKSANTVDTEKYPGTSTCTIAMLDKGNNKLYTALIGDSSYLILRLKNGKYYKEFKSDEQMHSECFNTPYQVGKDGDDPEYAITNTHIVKNNDLIIVATDG